MAEEMIHDPMFNLIDQIFPAKLLGAMTAEEPRVLMSYSSAFPASGLLDLIMKRITAPFSIGLETAR